MPLILPSNSISGEFEVANSLRFDDGSSDYLNKTFSTPTNNDICTLSFWIKKTGFSNHAIWSNGTTNENETNFVFQESGKFEFKEDVSNSATFQLITNRLFRDPSAWYHFVIAFDTTQATSSNRVKLYVNGSQETSFATETYPSQNTNIAINSNIAQYIGRRNRATDQYFDGYLAEMVFVDGQQLDPTSFGEFDEDTGIWKPIDVSGLTFGTNGFYLDFENSGSLGADVSGNGNNFTVNNLTSIDQTTDTCTNNYPTINSLENYNSSFTLSEGNLKAVTSNYSFIRSTIGVASGKWYMEVKCTAQTSNTNKWSFGISDVPASSSTQCLGNDNYTYTWRGDADKVYYNGSNTTYGTDGGMSTGMIVGIALDLDNNKIYWSRNGTWRNSADPSAGTNGFSIVAPSSTNNGFYHFTFGECDGTYNFTFETNYGNPPFTISSGNSDGNGFGQFEYQPPSGYLALCTKNLATDG